MLLPFLFKRPVYAGPPVTPGSVTYNAPGTYSFVVPAFNTLSVDVRGGSGGGGGIHTTGRPDTGYPQTGTDGSPGGQSSVGSPVPVVASPGGGGVRGYGTTSGNGANGAPGGGTGGTVTTGGGPAGGTGANKSGWVGGNGGPAGRVVKTFVRGELTKDTVITVVVGAPGSAGVSNVVCTPAVGGQSGSVSISWG